MDAFRGYPKIPRLYRPIRISEKLNGTNAAVCIATEHPSDSLLPHYTWVEVNGIAMYVWAQSRTRCISPEGDNYGFAVWVAENSQALAESLGPGRWFGEWAGKGIQGPYNSYTSLKTFLLFPQDHLPNSAYEHHYENYLYSFVPILYEGPFSEDIIQECVEILRQEGSYAYPGAQAEGIVVEFLQPGYKFKVLLKNDEESKGNVQR